MNFRSPLPIIILSAILTLSCAKDDPPEDCRCTCHSGDNQIEGWDKGKDSTIVREKDTVGGFEIVVDDWQNSDTHDINL